MKKIILIITILLLTCACSNNLKSIKVDNLEKKLKDKETFVLCLTDEESLTLKNTLEKVAKDKNIEAFYIDTDKLSDNDEDKLKTLFTYEDSNIIIFIKNGQENSILSRITDVYISQEDLKAELKAQGY